MTTRMKLTREQNRLLAEIMAKMNAENEAKAKPRRITLGVPTGATEVYNHRLPVAMAEKLIEMSAELRSSRAYIVYHLLRYALTDEKTVDVNNILELNAAKEYRNKQKD